MNEDDVNPCKASSELNFPLKFHNSRNNFRKFRPERIKIQDEIVIFAAI